jgi:hypothetical protein
MAEATSRSLTAKRMRAVKSLLSSLVGGQQILSTISSDIQSRAIKYLSDNIPPIAIRKTVIKWVNDAIENFPNIQQEINQLVGREPPKLDPKVEEKKLLDEVDKILEEDKDLFKTGKEKSQEMAEPEEMKEAEEMKEPQEMKESMRSRSRSSSVGEMPANDTLSNSILSNFGIDTIPGRFTASQIKQLMDLVADSGLKSIREAVGNVEFEQELYNLIQRIEGRAPTVLAGNNAQRLEAIRNIVIEVPDVPDVLVNAPAPGAPAAPAPGAPGVGMGTGASILAAAVLAGRLGKVGYDFINNSNTTIPSGDPEPDPDLKPLPALQIPVVIPAKTFLNEIQRPDPNDVVGPDILTFLKFDDYNLPLDPLAPVDYDRIMSQLDAETIKKIDPLNPADLFFRPDMIAMMKETTMNHNESDYSFLDTSPVAYSTWGIEISDSTEFFDLSNPTEAVFA